MLHLKRSNLSHQLHGNKVGAGLDFRVVRVRSHKLFHLVRVDVVRGGGLVVVARDVHVFLLLLGLLLGLGAQHARPLAVQQLATLGLALAGVAKVGTFKGMAFSAARALVAVSAEAKGSADGRRGRGCRVRVRAVRLDTVALGKMQTVGHTFRGQFMGKIAKLAVGAGAVAQKLFARRHLVGVVRVSASGSLGTGS